MVHELQLVFEQHGGTAGANDARGEFPGVRCACHDALSRHGGRRPSGCDRSSSRAAVCWRRRPAGAGSKAARSPWLEFPGNLLVAGSGLAWTDGFAQANLPKGYTVGGEISPFVNAARALELLGAGREAGPNDLACALESIRLTLHTLPASEHDFRVETSKLLQGLRRLDLVPSRAEARAHERPVAALRRGPRDGDRSGRPGRGGARPWPPRSQFPGAVPAQAPGASTW